MNLVIKKPFDAVAAASLLKTGVDVNETSFVNDTALLKAASASSPDAVKFLLAHGAKVNLVNYSEVSALMNGASLQSGDDALAIVTALVVAGADVNLRARDGSTALSLARKNINIRAADVLLKAGAKDDSKTQSQASKPTPTPSSSTLYDFIDPNFANSYSDTKLMALVGKKPFDAAVAASLIKSGEKVNAVGLFDETALMRAATASSPEAVKFLIANGAKVNLVNVSNRSALMKGASLSSGDDALAIVTALVAAGANVNLEGANGVTALSLARENSNLRAANVLIKAGATDTSSTQSATPKAASKPSSSSTTTSLDNSKLMNAAIKKPFDAVAATALLKKGENVNATNFAGETALMMAASISSPEAVQWLLANGAKVNLVDASGQSALMNGAALSSGNDALAIVTALVAAGAGVNLKNKNGETSLSLARKNINMRAADVLIKAGAKDDKNYVPYFV